MDVANKVVKNFAESAEALEAGETFYEDEKTSKSRGRPEGIDDAELVSARNYLVWLLENTWSEVGLSLRRVKTATDVRIALQSWEQYRDAHPLVDALLRPTERSTNSKKLRALDHRKSDLGQSVNDAAKQRQQCRESLEKADRVFTQDLTQDQKDIIAEQQAKRATALARAEAEYLAEQGKFTDAIQNVKDAHAYLARAEVARFCNSGRYAINPVNTANALAGWPYIGYRQSINRCRQWKPDNAGGVPYHVIKVFCRIVDSRKKSTKLIQHAESWLRSTRVSKSNEMFNAVAELRRNWYYLQRSIAIVVGARPLTRELPYKITTEYFRRLGARTAVDILFEEDERIVL